MCLFVVEALGRFAGEPSASTSLARERFFDEEVCEAGVFALNGLQGASLADLLAVLVVLDVVFGLAFLAAPVAFEAFALMPGFLDVLKVFGLS